MRIKSPYFRTSLLAVVLALSALLAGCATARKGAPPALPGPQSAPSGTEAATVPSDVDRQPQVDGEYADTSDSNENADDFPADLVYHEPATNRVAHVRARMDEAYESGLEAYQAGRFDEAKEHFDAAVDTVLTSGLDLSEEPELSGAFDEVVRNVADMDADLYTQNVSGRVTDSPLDALQDITSYLSPREAERERQRIEEFTAQVTYDLPMVLHPKVLSFVEIFQTRLRKQFEAGLERSGMYLPLIKKVFREEGIPEDLAYMAHQESAFKNTAYSRARAKGMWQFMSFTGRKYGLHRDIWVDERSDFEKATRAAAAYLKDNYALFGDWYLAMAAYNAGEGKIGRAIRRSGSRDFWTIAKTRHIRRETKNYIPAILASILIDKSPERYGFDTKINPVLEWDTLDLDKPTDLQVIADATGASMQDIRFLNPELRGLMTPPNVSTYRVRVPPGTREVLAAKLDSLTDEERLRWARHVLQPGENLSKLSRDYDVPLRAILDANPNAARRQRRLSPGTIINIPLSGGLPGMRQASREHRPSYEQGERVVHRVRRGDTLHRIASKYRTNVSNLKEWNNLNGTLIRPGQRIVAYYGMRGRSSAAVQASQPRHDAGQRMVHTVRRGDNLSVIAKRYGTTVTNLKRWNNIRGTVINPGQRLVVYSGVRSVNPQQGQSGSSEVKIAAARIDYHVRRGDNLSRIARRFGVTVNDLCSWNGLTPRSLIYPGERLWIGGQEGGASNAGKGGASGSTIEHRVKRGENLYRIAQRYNVSVKQVQTWNNLGHRSRIYPGQVLRIAVD